MAPFFLGAGGIFVDLTLIVGGKIHIDHSCFLDLAGVGDESLQVRLLQFQQFDLLGKGFLGVESGGIQNLPDLLQGELKLAEQQNGLQASQGFIVIKPVACLRHGRGAEQTDGVVMMERADADAGDFGYFGDCFHGVPSRLMI